MKRVFILLILALSWTACEEENTDPVIRLTDNSDVELTTDQGRFKFYKENRSSDDFQILEVIREEDLIRVVVQYAGGCEDHSLEVLWNQELKSLPDAHVGFNETELIVLHDAMGDLCEAALTDTLTIALHDLGENIDWDSYAVRIINGSRNQSFVSFFMLPSLEESELCLLEVEMERVICGDGLLGNAWFRYSDEDYLQPSQIATFMLIDPDLPEGNYLIGVKVTTWQPDPDIGICAAFPGYSVPVEIWCLEKVN